MTLDELRALGMGDCPVDCSCRGVPPEPEPVALPLPSLDDELMIRYEWGDR